MSSDVVGKSLELLREAVPALSRVVVIWNPDNAVFQAQMLRDTQLAAGRLGIELRVVAVRGPDDFEPAFSGIASTQAGALMVLSDPAYSPHALLTGIGIDARETDRQRRIAIGPDPAQAVEHRLAGLKWHHVTFPPAGVRIEAAPDLEGCALAHDATAAAARGLLDNSMRKPAKFTV